MAGGFNEATIAAQTAAHRADRAVEPGVVVRPQDYGTTVAVAQRTGINGHRRIHVGGGRVTHRRVLALATAADLDRPAARGAAGVDLSSGEQADLVALNRHRAAALAGPFARSVERAGDRDNAGLAAVEHDLAADVGDRPGLDHPALIDHRGGQVSGIPGPHHHGTAIGPDRALVLDQGVERTLIDRKVDQAVAAEINTHRVARPQRHAALTGGDHTLVADGGAEQGGIAPVNHRYRPLIDHRAGAAFVGEGIAPGHEVLVGDIERRCNDTADINPRARAK